MTSAFEVVKADHYDAMKETITAYKEALELKGQAYALLKEAAEDFKNQRDLLVEALESINGLSSGKVQDHSWMAGFAIGRSQRALADLKLLKEKN